MCAALTENIVLIRTRSHDLNSVRKLNCWGCALKDVSIVRRMPNVEVISLSINSIETLEYFSSCELLQELYLRKNEIKNINEILHLSQLQYLKKLSLEDNVCNQAENYRWTVLKALPNLEFLDNVKVTPEDIYQAEKLGRDLAWPGTETDEPYEEDITDLNQDTDYTNSSTAHHESQQSLSNAMPAQSNGYSATRDTHESNQYCGQSNDTETGASSTSSSSYHASNGNIANGGNSNNNNNNNSRNAGSHQYSNGMSNAAKASDSGYNSTNNVNGSGSNGNGKPKTNMAKSNSLSDYNIYNNGNYRGSSPPPAVTNYEANEYNYECSPANNNGQSAYSTPNQNGNYHQQQLSQQNGHLMGSNRTLQSSASSQSRLLPKGGKNRNANILSAVLCLIKELDYGSLEVVDTTIHCRMEEMED